MKLAIGARQGRDKTMPKFIVRDTKPLYVTFIYEIEAENEEQAYDNYIDNHPPCRRHELGNAVMSLDGVIEVKPA